MFLERGAFDATRPGATSKRAATRGWRCGSTATSSPSRERSRSRSSSARAPSTTSRRPGADGVRALAESDVVGVLLPVERALPRPADAAGAGARRCRRRGCARNRLQPRQRLLRKPAARLLTRLHPARAVAGRGARRVHCQRRARARPRGPDRTARAGLRRGSRPPRRARLAATSRTTSAARSSSAVVQAGRSSGSARLGLVPTRRSSAAGERRSAATTTSTSTSTRKAARSRSTSPSAERRAEAQERKGAGRATRGGRENRSSRRGQASESARCIFGAAHVHHGQAPRARRTAQAHVFSTVFLLLVFLPFSYLMDSFLYRSYQRRTQGKSRAQLEHASSPR